MPQRKVVAGGIAGAISYLILRILEGAGFQIQAQDAIALYTVVVFVIQYCVPNAKLQDETPTTEESKP